jgi:hypothetical protein
VIVVTKTKNMTDDKLIQAFKKKVWDEDWLNEVMEKMRFMSKTERRRRQEGLVYGR